LRVLPPNPAFTVCPVSLIVISLKCTVCANVEFMNRIRNSIVDSCLFIPINFGKGAKKKEELKIRLGNSMIVGW